MFKISVYYIITFILIFYKFVIFFISLDLDYKKGLREYAKISKIKVFITTKTEDDILSLFPIISLLETNNISHFITTSDSNGIRILKTKLVNSINTSLKNFFTLPDIIFSLIIYRPKIVITTASNAYSMFIIMAKILGCKIIIIENNKNLLENRFINYIGTLFYTESEKKNINYKMVGNLKILNATTYISKQKNNYECILIISNNKISINNYLNTMNNIIKLKPNYKIILIIPINSKFEIITLINSYDLPYYIWNNEPVDLNTLFIDFNIIISFDKNSLKYFSTHSDICLINTCLDKLCTYTFAELAINNNCIIYDSNCNNVEIKDSVIQEVHTNNIILKLDKNNDLYDTIIKLSNNNELRKYYSLNAYSWIKNMQTKVKSNLDYILKDINNILL